MSETFLKIVNMSISASWLVLAVLAVRCLFRKAPKWVNVLLWGIVAIRLVFPFSIESALSLIPSAETIPLNIELDTTPAIHTGVGSLDAIINPGLVGSNTPATGASINPLQITFAIYEAVWILGMAVMSLYMVISYLSLQRKLREAVILRDNIYQSVYADSPFVLGILRPRIYLPCGMTDRDMVHVIAHEQAHICRKDHWWKPLGFFLLTVHWFNPLMWVAYILLCRDIELACDEKVIRELGNQQRADYTQALLTASISRRRIAACPLAFGEVGVKERVRNVMNYRKPGFWIIAVALIVCLIVSVCFLTNPHSAEICYNGLVYVQQGSSVSALPDGSSEIGALVGIVHRTNEHPEKDYYATNLNEKYAGCTLYQCGTSPNRIFLYDYSGQYIPFVSEHYMLKARIHEIANNTFLVEPLPGSWEQRSTDRIYVPMKNMEPSPEPVVGDIICIEYDGILMATYPAQIGTVYRIRVQNQSETTDSTFARMVPTDTNLTGLHAGALLLPMESGTYRYLLTETNPQGVTADELLFSFDETDIGEPIHHEVYSLKDYPDRSKVLLISGKNGPWLCEYSPPQRCSDTALSDAIAAGYPVMEDGNATHGQDVWQKFYEQTQKGKSTSVTVAHYYTLNPAQCDSTYYEIFQQDYPCLYLEHLSYDGKQFTLTSSDGSTRTYEYLMKFETPDYSIISSQKPESSYQYVLTHDNSYTYEELWASVSSSYYGAYIDHYSIYSESKQ